MTAPCEACAANPEAHQLDIDGASVDIYGCSAHAAEVVRLYLLGRKVSIDLEAVRARLALAAASDRISTIGQLAVVLGGDPYGFTGQLLYALQKADRDNYARIRATMPDLAIAYEAWQECAIAPTPGQLWEQIRILTERWFAEQGLVVGS